MQVDFFFHYYLFIYIFILFIFLRVHWRIYTDPDGSNWVFLGGSVYNVCFLLEEYNSVIRTWPGEHDRGKVSHIPNVCGLRAGH